MIQSRLALPKVIGHRGAKIHSPENTIASFRDAHAQGAAWVEIDVRLSRDQVAAVLHDPSLLRTTGRDEEICNLAWDEVRQLDAGSYYSDDFVGEAVPSLATTLGCLKELGMGVNIEIKPNPGEQAVTLQVAQGLLDALWDDSLPPPLYSSFEIPTLMEAKAIAPQVHRGYLAHVLPDNWSKVTAMLECTTIHPGRQALTEDQVKAMKSEGYGIAVYTVNDPEEALRLLDWGVDSLITDTPQGIFAALDERGIAR